MYAFPCVISGHRTAPSVPVARKDDTASGGLVTQRHHPTLSVPHPDRLHEMISRHLTSSSPSSRSPPLSPTTPGLLFEPRWFEMSSSPSLSLSAWVSSPFSSSPNPPPSSSLFPLGYPLNRLPHPHLHSSTLTPPLPWVLHPLSDRHPARSLPRLRPPPLPEAHPRVAVLLPSRCGQWMAPYIAFHNAVSSGQYFVDAINRTGEVPVLPLSVYRVDPEKRLGVSATDGLRCPLPYWCRC